MYLVYLEAQQLHEDQDCLADLVILVVPVGHALLKMYRLKNDDCDCLDRRQLQVGVKEILLFQNRIIETYIVSVLPDIVPINGTYYYHHPHSIKYHWHSCLHVYFVVHSVDTDDFVRIEFGIELEEER